MRFVATTGGPKAAFDVRITELQIRAGAMLKPPMAPPPPQAAAVNLAPPAKEYAQQYFQPFKGSAAQPAGWELEGPADVGQFVRFEPTGLLFHLPPSVEGKRPNTGIRSTFSVKGDFEITLNFELLKEPASDDAALGGTALRLAIDLDTPKSNVATFSRSMNGVFYAWSSLWRDDAPKPSPPRGERYPTQAKAGRLRLIRSGSDLYFGMAETLDGDFVFKSKHRFGPEDLRGIRIFGVTGTETASLDVRLTGLRVGADAIPNMPASSSASNRPASTEPTAALPPASGKGWLFATLAAGIAIPLLAAIALGGFLYLRRGKVPASNDSPPAFLALACPDCGKKLKVKAELAGKKVKCGQCGKAGGR